MIVPHMIINGLLNYFDSNCLGHRAYRTEETHNQTSCTELFGTNTCTLQPHLIVFPLNMVIMNSIQLGQSLYMFTHFC